MKRYSILFMCLSFLLTACSKEEQIPVSGEVTIDNEIYLSQTYYSYGFSFALAKKISTMETPAPDVTIEYGIIEGQSSASAYLSANTFEPPFSLYGEYATPADAQTAFDALKSFGTRTWISFGHPLAEGQIWLVRCADDNYAKILITDLTVDAGTSPESASVTFKWVFQPDGTKTFSK